MVPKDEPLEASRGDGDQVWLHFSKPTNITFWKVLQDPKSQTKTSKTSPSSSRTHCSPLEDTNRWERWDNWHPKHELEARCTHKNYLQYNLDHLTETPNRPELDIICNFATHQVTKEEHAWRGCSRSRSWRRTRGERGGRKLRAKKERKRAADYVPDWAPSRPVSPGPVRPPSPRPSSSRSRPPPPPPPPAPLRPPPSTTPTSYKVWVPERLSFHLDEQALEVLELVHQRSNRESGILIAKALKALDAGTRANLSGFVYKCCKNFLFSG